MHTFWFKLAWTVHRVEIDELVAEVCVCHVVSVLKETSTDTLSIGNPQFIVQTKQAPKLLRITQ